MKRLRLTPKIIFPLIFCLIYEAANLAFIRVALLHPEQINAKDDAGMWVTRTPYQIKINGLISLAIGVGMFCVGAYMIYYILKGYIFYIRDETFSCTLDDLDLNTTPKIGPLSGLRGKGLTLEIHLKPAWEQQQPMRSFRLYRTHHTPPYHAVWSYYAMSYQVQLFGSTDNEDVMINERTFKPGEEGERDSNNLTWEEKTFTINNHFDEYFVKIKLIPPNIKKLVDADKATVLLKLKMNVSLRWKDLKQWNSNPECSLRSAQVQLLD